MISTLSSRIILGVVFVHLAAAAALIWLSPGVFDLLVEEDGWCENAGAAVFAATAVLLFFAAQRERRTPEPGRGLRATALGLAALAFLVAAGEEISWGQRIFGFSTPPELMAINDQNEFNLHNIEKGPIDRAVHYGMLLAGAGASAWFMAGRRRLLGFRTPDAAWALAILVIPLVQHPADLDKAYLLALATLAAWGVYFLVKRNRRGLYLTAAATVAAAIVALTFNAHGALLDSNSTPELREYLLAIICLGLAIELRHDAGARLAGASPASAAGS